ncbi:hypothetical protein V1525DRAFT_360784 [Lipomyces kononenkoae]|uniref:Uncharacterized protein n=1 Tax=Lipomyces kononenkoae TaxID=34357 RepID=A0ACC3T2Q6_LIPKO
MPITVNASNDLFSSTSFSSRASRPAKDEFDGEDVAMSDAESAEAEAIDVDEDDDDDDDERLFSLDHNENGDGDARVTGVVKSRHIVTPGELVTADSMWMRGHGTYSVGTKSYSSVAGTITRVNKLLSVAPLRGRYDPKIGDHVVGRIIDVGTRSWHVDIGAKQAAVLMLGSVNLPGGVQRRKSESDELQMRAFLKEGDLLNAEVQAVFTDGAASLHTRSLNYGKLRNGYFFTIPSSLVVRSKYHTFELPGGVDLVLGVNGYLWLRKHTQPLAEQGVSITRIAEEAGWEIYSDENEYISVNLRDTIARYANAIKALAYCEVGVNEARILAAYEASKEYKSPGEMIENNVKKRIAKYVLLSTKG